MSGKPKQLNSKTVYKKVGRRYVPIGEHIEHDRYPYGSYVMLVRPGVTSICKIDMEKFIPEVEVAVKLCAEALSRSLVRAKETPSVQPLTAKQLKAFDMWREAFCTNSVLLPSAYDVVHECTKELSAFLSECLKEKGILHG